MKKFAAVALLAFTILPSLSACGGHGGDPASSVNGHGGQPDLGPGKQAYAACGDVWKAGKTLPTNYDGCMLGDMAQLGGDWECKNGTKLVTYDPQHMWAVTGQTVHTPAGDSASDPAYGKAYKTCMG